MALVVETGTGAADAESYVSVAVFQAYCAARAITPASADVATVEAGLRRATAALDAKYRPRFKGYRTNRRKQALEWPRTNALDDANRVYIGQYEIPVEVINATCEAAVRELASPGAMNPDVKPSAFVKRRKAGSVEIEFKDSGPVTTTFLRIDQILAPVLTGGAAGFIGFSARG